MCDARLVDEDVRETTGEGVFGFLRNMTEVWQCDDESNGGHVEIVTKTWGLWQ